MRDDERSAILALVRLLLALFTVALALGCQSGAAVGTTCARDAECSTPLVCRLGRCRSACVQNRDCPVGAQCYLGAGGLGACELDLDRCGGVITCGNGLTCLAAQCVRACSSAAECPSDGTCAIGSGASIGVCVDARATDGGVGDAAADSGVPPCQSVQHVSVGFGYVCTILGDTTVACWGRDSQSQTGAAPSGEQCGGVPCRLRPVRVVDDMGAPIHATQLSSGAEHACVVATDGRVLCWGAAYDDMRGNGDLTPAPNATEAFFDQSAHIGWGRLSAPRASQVSVGRFHTCVLGMDGHTARCWGPNDHGEIGIGSSSATSSPPVEPTALIAPLTAPYDRFWLGDGFTCLTDTLGHVACVGLNNSGQLGPSLAVGTNAIAAAVDPALGGSLLAVGDSHLCALGSTGGIRCVGANDRGQLGRDTGGAPQTNVPGPVAGSTTFDAIWSTLDSGATFARSGTHVFAWGDNVHGVTAVASTTELARLTPELVSVLGAAAAIGTDGSTACALTSGSLSCWGANETAQLGRGQPGADDPTPVHVCIMLP